MRKFIFIACMLFACVAHSAPNTGGGGGGGGGGLTAIVQDTTPEFGGEVDALGNNILNVGDITADNVIESDSPGSNAKILQANDASDYACSGLATNDLALFVDTAAGAFGIDDTMFVCYDNGDRREVPVLGLDTETRFFVEGQSVTQNGFTVKAAGASDEFTQIFRILGPSGELLKWIGYMGEETISSLTLISGNGSLNSTGRLQASQIQITDNSTGSNIISNRIRDIVDTVDDDYSFQIAQTSNFATGGTINQGLRIFGRHGATVLFMTNQSDTTGEGLGICDTNNSDCIDILVEDGGSGSGSLATSGTMTVMIPPSGVGTFEIEESRFDSSAATTRTITTAEMDGRVFRFTSGTGSDVTLPAAAVGLNACFYITTANVLILDSVGDDQFLLHPTGLLTAANAIDTDGSAGAYACIEASTTSEWVVRQINGVMIDGGAN